MAPHPREIAAGPAEGDALAKDVDRGREIALLVGDHADLIADLDRRLPVGRPLEQGERLVVHARRDVHLAEGVVDRARATERVSDQLGVAKLARQRDALIGQRTAAGVVGLPRG